MRNITKIIAVLNDFKSADNIIQKALHLSSQQNASLEILYVHEEPLFDLPDYFQSQDSVKNPIIDKEKIKTEIKARVAKLNERQDCAILVFIDDTEDRVLTQLRDEEETLIVTAYHDKITERLVKKSHVPVLVVKSEVLVYEKAVLPVDLSDTSRPCISLAQTLFAKSEIRLVYDYRYIVDVSSMDIDYLGAPTAAPIVDMQLNQEIKENQMKVFDALKKETGIEGDFIEEAISTEDDLSQYIEAGHFDLTILCTNNKDFLLENSISFALLETLSNDVLIYRHTF